MYNRKQTEFEITNSAIEDAISDLEKDDGEENVYALIHAIQKAAVEGGEFFVPILDADETEDPAEDLRSITKLDLRAYLDPNHVPAATPRKVELYRGGYALTAFTSRAELNKGEGTKYTSMPILAFLELAFQEDQLVGVVLNPWDVSVLLDRKIIEIILQPEDKRPAGKIYIDKGDLTRMHVDAVVNAANTSLMAGGGVCGAIFAAAGPGLHNACARLGGCAVGEAKITPGFDLPARFIIHTPGPVYSGSPEDERLLENSYYNSLEVARQNGLRSIAFPAISTGIYGYPLEEAIPVAFLAVSRWIAEHRDYPMDIHLVCFDDYTFEAYKRHMES